MIDWLLYLETQNRNIDGTKFEFEQQCLYAPPPLPLLRLAQDSRCRQKEPIIINYNETKESDTVIILDI